MKTRGDLRGTWPQALGSLALAFFVILAIRWALIEPYVIPSGSMLPTLLIRDHILVNKFAYGIRLPFSSYTIVRWGEPRRGDVIVFRSVETSDIFLVKRVVGTPGDKIQIRAGGLEINGERVSLTEQTAAEADVLLSDWTPAARAQALSDFRIMTEKLSVGPQRDSIFVAHSIFLDKNDPQIETEAITVPAGHLFVSGDNRDHSADSRIWGTLPTERVLGKAALVWLSCEEALADTGQLCNPRTIRWKRFWKRVD